MRRRGWIGSSLLLVTLVATGGILAVWKYSSLRAADSAAANQPEPTEMVTTAVAKEVEHRQTIDFDRNRAGTALDHPA